MAVFLNGSERLGDPEMTRKITALKVQKRNKKRVNVFLNDEFAFGLSRHVAAWLEVGMVLSDQKVLKLLSEDQIEGAYQKALRLLSYRPRSEAEVRDNLIKHAIEDHVIEQVIARLRQSGMLNDQAFAEAWITNRSEFSPRGRRALRAELRQKRVDDGIINELLAPIDEAALAYRAAKLKTRKGISSDRQEYFRKMSGFLSRRGFGYEFIRPTLERIWQEHTAEG